MSCALGDEELTSAGGMEAWAWRRTGGAELDAFGRCLEDGDAREGCAKRVHKEDARRGCARRMHEEGQWKGRLSWRGLWDVACRGHEAGASDG